MRFVQVGAHWINLDLVTSIEFLDSPMGNTAEPVVVRIHYSNSKSHDFDTAEEIEVLRKFLKAHRAK